MRKKVLSIMVSLTMVISLLPWSAATAISKSGGVSLDSRNFSDRQFRNYVSRFDKDKNGKLSYKELKRVKKIQVDERGIKSLKGLEYFKWLEKLDCSENKIKVIDVRMNEKLKELDCSENKIKVIDVRMNRKLKELDCSENKIKVIDVRMNRKLKELDCSHNKIKNLNIDNIIKLEELNCSYNQLSNLQLDKNKRLRKIICHHNNLLYLDLSQNPLLDDDDDDYDYEDADDDECDYDDDDEINSISPQERIVSPQDKGNYYEIDIKALLGAANVERVMFVTGKGVTEKDGIISIKKGAGNKGRVIYDCDTRNPINSNRLMKVILRWKVETDKKGKVK